MYVRCSERPRLAFALAALAFVTSCARAPVLQPIAGTPVAPGELPQGRLVAERGTVFFTWEYSDAEMGGRGDGVARLVAPDSARLDFFLAGGLGGGRAVLIGDSLRVPNLPGVSLVRRMIPPTPLMWAAVGRFAVPPAADTAAATDGTRITGDIGRPAAWRVTFHGDSLTRLERVSDGRVVEWVERAAGRVRYRNETARRELRLQIERTEPAFEFNEAIWTP